MDATALSLLPPAIALGLAFSTRRIIPSLLAGITVAALMATNYSPLAALEQAASYIWKVTELGNFASWGSFIQSNNLFVFAFLLFVGMVMAFMERSGDAYAYAAFLKKHLGGKRAASQASFAFSLVLFVDDYLSSTTTSSVMPTLTDAFKIARIKISYLAAAMAVPLCTLIPISVFAPPVTRFIASAGVSKASAAAAISAEAFALFVESIPFVFQSILTILGAFFVVRMSISYGIIGKHEKIAERTGNVFGNKREATLQQPKEEVHGHSLFGFFFPLLALLVSVTASMIYLGRSNISISLAVGGTVAFMVSSILQFLKANFAFTDYLSSCKKGILEMGQSIIVLVLAWTLAEFIAKDLQTGVYIAGSLMPFLRVEFLPAGVFILGGLVSFALGSSWSTMTIMFPLAIPMVPALLRLTPPCTPGQLPLIFPVIGAVVSGAVFGSSMSPIADILNIISGNTKVDRFDFVKAQAQYLAPTGLGSLSGFLVAGFTAHLGYGTSLALSLPVSIIVTAGAFLLFHKLGSGLKNQAKDAKGWV